MLGKTITSPEDFFQAAEQCLCAMRIEEAVRFYKAAESAGYSADACSAGRWICHMLSGEFEHAWRESDLIQKRGNPDPQRFWNGAPFDGKRVLIRCLHGLGDTIQFIRYAPLIREHAATLSIEAQPRLKLLIEYSRLADRVITWGEPEPPWDQQMEVIELPRVFRTSVETIPAAVPYLAAPSNEPVSPCDGAKPLRIAIVWTSGNYNPARSIPFEYIEQLFETGGVSFFSLQAGDERRQLASWRSRITDCYEPSETPFEMAMRIKTMDLVITADTMAAHLAGAMAKPVWTLLPFQCDWRWMMEREDSPWYPTMRLFRQPKPGDWRAVMHRVAVELEAVVAETCSRATPDASNLMFCAARKRKVKR